MKIAEVVAYIKDYFFIFVIWLFHAVLNVWFIFKDTRPPAWDQSTHLILSLMYSRGSSILLTSNYYPPLFHVISAPLSSSYDISICINFVFLAILLFSIYGIGKTLFNREVGLLSALIISFYPFLIAIQRDFLLDFSLVSIISLSLYFLFKTENFKNTKYSILFGVSVGCALLIKWTAIFFLIAPVIWVLWQSIKEKKRCDYCNKIIKNDIITKNFYNFCSERHKNKFTKEGISFFKKEYNFFFFFFSSLLTSGVWYIAHPDIISIMLKAQHRYGVIEGEASPLSVASFSHYFSAINIQVFFFFSILSLIGLILLLWNGDKDKKILIGLSLLFPYLVFSLTYNKDVRYTIPILIFISLISANWIINLKHKNVKKVIIAIVLVIGLLQTSTITFGVPDISSNYYPNSITPRQEDWQVNNVLNTITDTLPKDLDHRPLIVVLPDHSLVNGLTYTYYTILREESYLIYNSAYLPKGYIQNIISDVDYVVYKRGGHIAGSTYEKQVNASYKVFEEKKGDFVLISVFDLPDNSKLELYQSLEK